MKETGSMPALYGVRPGRGKRIPAADGCAQGRGAASWGRPAKFLESLMSGTTTPAETLIDLDLATAREIIALADAYKADLQRRLGAAPAAEAVAADVQAGASAELRALTARIAALTRAERAELVGLMWYAQEDDYETFAASRTFAIATADTGIPQYLAKKGLTLADLLRQALTKMGYRL
jgi:hypothetical protein